MPVELMEAPTFRGGGGLTLTTAYYIITHTCLNNFGYVKRVVYSQIQKLYIIATQIVIA